MIDESLTRQKLRQWVEKRAKSQGASALTDQTALLTTGLLRSLDIVEFVLFIESLRDEEVDTDAIEPDAFTSIDTIWKAFFAPLVPAPAAAVEHAE